MNAPYNPAPGGDQSGAAPQWGGYPGGANYPPSGQPGYPDPAGSGGYQQQPGGYQQGYQPGGYQYQQPPGGYSYPQPQWGYGAQPRESVGIVGLALAAVGAILLIVSFTALNWYPAPGGKFSDLKDAAKAADVSFAKMFAGWLAWVLLVLVILVAVAANLPIGPSALALRIIAPVLGVAGIVITLLALNTYWNKIKDAAQSQGIDVGVFKHSQIGLYLALAGFLVAGVAGVFGPRRT